MYISFLKGVGLGLVAYGIGFIMDIKKKKKSFDNVIEDGYLYIYRCVFI